MATMRIRKKVTEPAPTEEQVEVKIDAEEPVKKVRSRSGKQVEAEVEVKETIEPIEPIEPIEFIKPVVPISPVVTEDTPIRWKKVGHGSFILNNRFIKPGQIFTAKINEIPNAFRDVVIPLDKIPELDAGTPRVNYSLQPVEGSDLFNIIDKQGKVLNESPMSKEDAQKFLSML